MYLDSAHDRFEDTGLRIGIYFIGENDEVHVGPEEVRPAVLGHLPEEVFL